MMNKNTNIIQIEGKDLLNSGKKGLKTKGENKKRYKATLDYSLECLQLDKVAKSVYKDDTEKQNIFYNIGNKQYTDAIVSVTFKYSVKEYVESYIKKDKKYKYYIKFNYIDTVKLEKLDFPNDKYYENDVLVAFRVIKNKKDKTNYCGETIISSKDIRDKLYENGFKLNGKKMVRFKRSSGSSRIGKCLFILEDLYNDIIEWSYMGLKFGEADECDLAALEAYIALTTSSIIDTIEIKPENILLINDYDSLLTDEVMATEIEVIDGINKLITKPKTVKIKNTIWDGQSLLDSSIMAEKYSDKGFLLLRNRMTKTACFNSNIQKFFSDNNITEISQLNGTTKATKIEDILMITTPSSIKYLKFNDNFMDYLDQLESTWGVVKYDKPTHYFNGEYVSTHYQLLNTLQMDKAEIENFLEPSFDYIKLLKNDINVFRKHLKMKLGETIEERNLNNTNDLMFSLLECNNDVEKTDVFQDFRDDAVDSFIKNMRKGHVLVQGNYSVLFGNGLEMLKATIKDIEHPMAFHENSVLVGNEVHCTNFAYTELLGCRSPHVTMGNLALMQNVECPVLDKYFNLTPQIICVNSMKYNLLETLSSADFDSDQLLLTNNHCLLQAFHKNLDNNNRNKFLVPTDCIAKEYKKSIPRLNNAKQKCDLDVKTSVNLIGEIINCSQQLNSKLWHMINVDGKSINDTGVQDLYSAICQLDVMSCLEIDKAKREIPVDNGVELDAIREKYLDFELVHKDSYKTSERINKLYDEMIYFKINKHNREDCKIDDMNYSEYLKDYRQQLVDYKDKLKDYKLTKVRPTFFKYIAKKENQEHKYCYQSYDTGMDILEEVITEQTKNIRAKRNSKNDLMQLIRLIDKEEVSLSGADNRKIPNIITDTEEYNKDSKQIWSSDNLESSEKYIKCKTKQNELAEKYKDKVTKDTMYKIIHTLCHTNEYDHIARKLLTILFKTNSKTFLEIFQDKQEKLPQLKRLYRKVNADDQIIKIYDMNYILIKESEIKSKVS
ncbi:hypothetical protein [Clostridium pasteurianum]|uniref:RNA dependent RNA polymerase n=1 Tax=Clostridium pasteurianum BC1 TaxID=86416 RepID=R4K104_CLOPA|nr:hypothetical protein [Clostridium pasteurianum]AGK96772.1 hypothetical protein Clopa_1872 [Clostridium pasteurianum BC1]